MIRSDQLRHRPRSLPTSRNRRGMYLVPAEHSERPGRICDANADVDRSVACHKYRLDRARGHSCLVSVRSLIYRHELTSRRIYRRDIKASLSPFIRPTSVEKVLLLLLESGSFYCLIWVRRRSLIPHAVSSAAGRSSISSSSLWWCSDSIMDVMSSWYSEVPGWRLSRLYNFSFTF